MTGIFVACLLLFAFAPFFFASPQRVLPKCTIVKGKEKLNINLSDLPAWEKKGWKRADDPVPSEEDEGEYTLEEAIEKCRSKAALEEIVEANGIDVDLGEIEKFADQKEAVLEAIAEEADE